MKTFEVKRLNDKSGRSCCTQRQIKLKVGMVFEITGDTDLNGVYTITEQKKVYCALCPLSLQDSKYALRFCGLLKESKLGCRHMFCQKDLRSVAYGDNAFTIKKLDNIMESL